MGDGEGEGEAAEGTETEGHRLTGMIRKATKESREEDKRGEQS